MRGSMLRQTLLTNNLANASTPGYQRSDVNFEDQLKAAISSGEPVDQISFSPAVQQGQNNPNGNDVSTEQEQAYISENSLLYQTLTQVAGSREQMLKTAIGVA